MITIILWWHTHAHTHSCHTVSAGELRVLTQEVGVVGGGGVMGVVSGCPLAVQS